MDATFTAILVTQGLKYIASENWEKASSILTEAILSNPNDIRLWSLRCNVFLRMDNDEDALKDAEKMVSMNRNNAEAFYLMGEALSRLYRCDEALKCFRKATILKPEDETIKKALQRCLQVVDNNQNTDDGGCDYSVTFEDKDAMLEEQNQQLILLQLRQQHSLVSNSNHLLHSNDEDNSNRKKRMPWSPASIFPRRPMGPYPSPNKSEEPDVTPKYFKSISTKKQKPAKMQQMFQMSLSRSVRCTSAGTWFKTGQSAIPQLHPEGPRLPVPSRLRSTKLGCPYSPEMTVGACGLFPHPSTIKGITALDLSLDEQRKGHHVEYVNGEHGYQPDVHLVPPKSRKPLRERIREAYSPAVDKAKFFPGDVTHDSIFKALRVSQRTPSAFTWPRPATSMTQRC